MEELAATPHLHPRCRDRLRKQSDVAGTHRSTSTAEIADLGAVRAPLPALRADARYDSVAPTEALPALLAIPVRGVEEFFRGCQIVKKPERGDLVYVAKGQPLRQQETRAIEVHAPYGRVKCFHRLPLET